MRTKLAGIRIHDLRHLGVGILLLRDTPDAVAAKLTGHRTLLARYQHLSLEFRKAMVDLIAQELTMAPGQGPDGRSNSGGGDDR